MKTIAIGDKAKLVMEIHLEEIGDIPEFGTWYDSLVDQYRGNTKVYFYKEDHIIHYLEH